MINIKKITQALYFLNDDVLCKCKAKHVVCIRCQRCIADEPDQLITDMSTLNQYIDHTLLRPETKLSEIQQLCLETNEHNFKTVCVNPCYVFYASNFLEPSKICTVVNFPLGANHKETNFYQTKKAMDNGAKEIDIVINLGNIKQKNYAYDEYENLALIAKLTRSYDAILKVIIETCLLTDEEIVIACLTAKKAGADFVKTSTGFSFKGAEIDKVKLMRQVVGPKMGVKASGGIKTKDQAIAFLKAGANRLGTSNSINIISTQTS